jgi:hypothetical protein
MSTKLKAVEKPEEQPAEVPEFTEELMPLSIDPNSFDARVAGVEPCSLLRELSKHWGTVTAFQIEQEKLHGDLEKPETAPTHEESWEREQKVRARKRELWLQKWEPKTAEELDEDIQYIKRKAAQYIDWDDLGRLWNADPRAALDLWKAIRLEARDEFISGHYASRVFETADYMHDAFKRAQQLAIRDGLIEEWRPRGASEFILIDQMTHAYVMQIHWTEEAMMRAQTEPRVESYEYRKYAEQRKIQEKQWGHGYWDIPYQQTAEAVEQAFRLVDLCQKSFQRAARQLANIRLVRAKTVRARRRERTKVIQGVRVA